MPSTDYNNLITAIGHRDVLRKIAAAALADDMRALVTRLVEAGILAPGTTAQRPSVLHPE